MAILLKDCCNAAGNPGLPLLHYRGPVQVRELRVAG